MKGLLSGLKSESIILCDAAATSAEDEASSSTRSPLRMPSSLQNVSGRSIHSGSAGSASSSFATASRSAIVAATDGNETAKLTHTIMTLKLEMAELRTSLDATSNRDSKLRAANADLEDRCARLTTERDKYKSKLRKAVDALSQSRARAKDMERTNAELRVRLEATEAERDGAKRERRSALDKLLSSASFDDDYGSIFDEGDGASVATDAVASTTSRAMRSFRSADSVDNPQRYDYVAELKGGDGGNNNPLPSRHKSSFRRGRKPNMSRDEPRLQQHQCPSSGTLSDGGGYIRGQHSSTGPGQHASTSLCSLADDKGGATAMLELNDMTPRSTRVRHSNNRRCRSMGDDGVEWNAARPTAANGPKSWLRQSLDHVFTPGVVDDDSSKRESWKERPFRIPSILGTPNDAPDDRRASLASLASMESEQVAIEDAFDPKKGIQGIAAPPIQTSTVSPVPLPTNTNTRSLSSSGGTSSDGARSDMACATHNNGDSLSVEDLSWPSQEERRALKEMRSRPSSTEVDTDSVPGDVVANDKNEEDGNDDSSIQPTGEILGNDSKNSNSSHDTARDVDLFFDMLKAKDDDSFGSEDAQYHEQPLPKSDVSKDGTNKKGEANSASSYRSLEGGKIPLKRMPRRNSCDAQAA